MTNTRYTELAELLRQTVLAADTGPAGGLPTEAELCARYGVSRTTVRRALLALRAEGLLQSRQGSGWVVAPRHRRAPAPRYRVRASTARAASPPAAAPSFELLGHRRLRPPRAIADALQADRAGALLMIESVTRAGRLLIHRGEVWFNTHLSARLDPAEASAHPPARLLARHGQSFGRFDQFVEAVAANRRDQQILGLALGKPVLQVVRTAFDRDGNPLFRSLHRHPGHNTEIEIWLPTSHEPDGGSVTIEGTR